MNRLRAWVDKSPWHLRAGLFAGSIVLPLAWLTVMLCRTWETWSYEGRHALAEMREWYTQAWAEFKAGKHL